MRLGFIAQQLSRHNGGVSEAVRLTCEALLQRGGVDISLFCADDDRISEDIKAFPPLALHTARAFGSQRYGFAPGMVKQLLDTDLDVLHVHGIWSFHACAAWIWHRITGRPVVVSPHGMLEAWILQRSSKLKKLVSRLYLNDLSKRAVAFQALTVKEVADIQQVLPGKHCEVIAHYVPLRGEEAQLPTWWRAGDEGKRIFVFLGRLHEKKGINELCDAWEMLCAEQPEMAAQARLVLCGWNDGIAGFEDRVAALEQRFGNITYAGPQYGDEKWRSLAAASFMLLPSHSEGLPMAIVEGWSAGLPSIMTAACNLPEGFVAGAALETGTSPDRIRASLERGMTMPADELAAMNAAARQLVRDNFSAAAVADRLMAVYAAGISKTAPRP